MALNTTLVKSTVVAALGGLLFGFDTAVIAGATAALTNAFQLSPNGLGITVSYWATEDALRAWKANAEHSVAQRQGRAGFYKAWFTRVCKVERAYSFEL